MHHFILLQNKKGTNIQKKYNQKFQDKHLLTLKGFQILGFQQVIGYRQVQNTFQIPRVSFYPTMPNTCEIKRETRATNDLHTSKLQ